MNCPKHGKKLREIKINLLNGKYGLVSAYCCYDCMKAYIDIKGIDNEDLGTTISGYEIVNLNSSCSIPNVLHLLGNDYYKSLPFNCKRITEFEKDGNHYKFSTKFDYDNNVYYINSSILFTNLKLFRTLNMKVDYKEDLVLDCKEIDPNEIYIMNKSELGELTRIKKILNIERIIDKDLQIHKIPLKYDEEKDIYLIDNEVYAYYKLAIHKLKIKCTNVRLNKIIDMTQYAVLPKKIYVLEDTKIVSLSHKKDLTDVNKFMMKYKEDFVFFWIPMKCEKQTGKYYITRHNYNLLRDELKRKCNLNIKLSKKKNHSEICIYANQIVALPYEATVIDKDICPKCQYNLIENTKFLNDSKKNVKIRLSYCNKCGKYYINLTNFNNKKNLYLNNIKNIIGVTGKNEKTFDEKLYINRTIWNLTYGQGVFIKIQGSTLFVDFGGNLHSFRFPDCFKTGKIRFIDDNPQKSMMEFINNNDKIVVKNQIKNDMNKKNTVITKNVMVANTKSSDVRRIPGLVYKIQLIGPSNNHATRIHPVENVVVKLAYRNPKSKMFDIVSIPMHYCSRCDKYFDMKQSFLQTLQKYNLDINYFAASFESETGHPIVFKQMDLREFSKLKLFGYSVGANGLSTGARHELLDFILKNHLMTASEIKSQLQFNIRFIGKKAHMDDAVGDWEKDIDYVNNYISSGKIHWRY